jgi:hypothetical protein
MSTITIPESLKSVFAVNERTPICDESGNILGYYTPTIPRRTATDEDYEWAFKNITAEQIQASLASGPGRPLSDTLAELRAKYGP